LCFRGGRSESDPLTISGQDERKGGPHSVDHFQGRRILPFSLVSRKLRAWPLPSEEGMFERTLSQSHGHNRALTSVSGVADQKLTILPEHDRLLPEQDGFPPFGTGPPQAPKYDVSCFVRCSSEKLKK